MTNDRGIIRFDMNLWRFGTVQVILFQNGARFHATWRQSNDCFYIVSAVLWSRYQIVSVIESLGLECDADRWRFLCVSIFFFLNRKAILWFKNFDNSPLRLSNDRLFSADLLISHHISSCDAQCSFIHFLDKILIFSVHFGWGGAWSIKTSSKMTKSDNHLCSKFHHLWHCSLGLIKSVSRQHAVHIIQSINYLARNPFRNHSSSHWLNSLPR